MAMEAPLPSKRCKLYWEAEEQQSILQLMLGSPAGSARASVSNRHRGLQDASTTAMVSGFLDGPAGARLLDDPLQQKFNESFELDSESPLPPGWEKCLDLKTGSMYYLDRNTGLRTPIDPRRKLRAAAAASHAHHHHHQPSSPSSSSELTTEPSMASSSIIKPVGGSLIAAVAEAKPVACKRPLPTSAEIEGFDSDDCAVDLTLSLGPSSNKICRNLSAADPRSSSSFMLGAGLLCPPGDVLLKETTTVSSTTMASCYEANNGRHQTPVVAVSSSASASASSHEEYEHYVRSSSNNKNKKNSPMNFGAQGMSLMMNHGMTMMTKVEEEEEDKEEAYAVDLEETMVTAGCPHCLMFVMLSRSADPRCPKCGASLSDAVTQMENAATLPDAAIILPHHHHHHSFN